MDVNVFLKIKKRIKVYRIGSFILIIGGSFFLTIDFVYFFLFPGSLGYAFFIGLSVALIILGLWAKSKAMDLKIGLDAYDREQERYDRERKRRKYPPAALPITILRYCPYCGKRLRPTWKAWKACVYCGKKLEKSD